MQHINIQAVETKAAELEAFASHPTLRDFEAADYRARAANLQDFARTLQGWRALDALQEQAKAEEEAFRKSIATW